MQKQGNSYNSIGGWEGECWSGWDSLDTSQRKMGPSSTHRKGDAIGYHLGIGSTGNGQFDWLFRTAPPWEMNFNTDDPRQADPSLGIAQRKAGEIVKAGDAIEAAGAGKKTSALANYNKILDSTNVSAYNYVQAARAINSSDAQKDNGVWSLKKWNKPTLPLFNELGPDWFAARNAELSGSNSDAKDN